MPSGAKKRKAAKKKKIQETNNNNSAHSCGGDEKESYGREVSSFASQEHHESGHSFAEGGDAGSRKSVSDSSARLIAAESNSVETVTCGDDTLKVSSEAEDDYKSKNISIESITEEVHNGVPSRSSRSSSSSDDESAVVEDITTVIETGVADESVETLPEVVAQLIENITVEETDDKVVESCASVYPVKLVSSLSDMLNKVNDIIPARETDNGVVETEHTDSLKPTDCPSEVVNDTITIGKTRSGDVETASLLESEKEALIEQTVKGIESASGVNPNISCVLEWDPQVTREEKVLTLDKNNAVSADLENLGSREKELLTSQTAATGTDTKDSFDEVHDDKLKLSYNSPVGHTTNGAQLVPDYQNPEHFSNQCLAASKKQTLQKTSIKSCCGIFELFTSSDR